MLNISNNLADRARFLEMVKTEVELAGEAAEKDLISFLYEIVDLWIEQGILDARDKELARGVIAYVLATVSKKEGVD